MFDASRAGWAGALGVCVVGFVPRDGACGLFDRGLCVVQGAVGWYADLGWGLVYNVVPLACIVG